jgi:RsiW-degrading membrane proteinase PrsW (M82 family)
VAGLCEEYIKLQIVKNYAYCKPSFDEIMDGIVYTSVASMGFACMENILYVMNDAWHTAIARGFTAVPLHAVCSGMMGYIGRAKFANTKEQEKFLIYKGLWQAVAIHGLYDFLLFISPKVGSIFSVIIVPLIFWTYLRLKSRIRLASETAQRKFRK